MKKRKTKLRWDEHEAQAFRDGCRRKAQTFGDKRKEQARNACRATKFWN